jgi:hypothetical protein
LLAIAIGWSLFSLFLAVWVYVLLANLGLTAFVISALVFLHLFGAVAVWRGLMKKESCGVAVFACWLLLSLLNAASLYSMCLSFGVLGALAITILAWLVLFLTYSYLNRTIFGFPDFPLVFERIDKLWRRH